MAIIYYFSVTPGPEFKLAQLICSLSLGAIAHVVSMTTTVGVLALQGAFLEHLVLLRKAADYLGQEGHAATFDFTEVRNVRDLARCDALIIPGGESTTMALVAAQSGLLEPLRDFVKYVIPYLVLTTAR